LDSLVDGCVPVEGRVDAPVEGLVDAPVEGLEAAPELLFAPPWLPPLMEPLDALPPPEGLDIDERPPPPPWPIRWASIVTGIIKAAEKMSTPVIYVYILIFAFMVFLFLIRTI
jgi:hypothetical protein